MTLLIILHTVTKFDVPKFIRLLESNAENLRVKYQFNFQIDVRSFIDRYFFCTKYSFKLNQPVGQSDFDHS